MDQRTDEWFQARVGKVTASKIADLTARTKSGWAASRGNYCAQLVAERLTGVNQDGGFINAAMQWGIDKEPEAIAAYEYFQDVTVSPVGFIDHPTIAASGASPDGFVNLGPKGPEGLVEAKCPNTMTHIETLKTGKVPEKYRKQMLWQLACVPAAAYCDFISFDPRMPPEHQLFVDRIWRDDKAIVELEDMVRVFLNEVLDTIDQLNARNKK